MAGKNLSQLGYLMELLNLSATELSEYLNIERTTVSKWKSGARAFSNNSHYSEAVIEFLIKKNNRRGSRVLNRFFESIYSKTGCVSNDCLRKSITKFIGETEVPAVPPLPCYNEKGALYKSNFYIYRGAEGRKHAVSLMLTSAKNLDVSSQICFLENSGFQWVGNDENYLHELTDSLRQILEMGHKIDLITLVSFDYLPNGFLLKNLLCLSLYDNFKYYIAGARFSKLMSLGIYAIKDRFLAMGLNGDLNLASMYTSIFHDKLTVNQTLTLFDNFKSITQPVRLASKKSEKDEAIKIIRDSEKTREPLFFVGNYLSVATMSRELFYTILENNSLSKPDRDRCIAFFNSVKAAINISSFNVNGGFLFYHDNIADRLKYESVALPELCALSAKCVTMTRAQYLHHLRETAEFLLDNPKIRVFVNHGKLEYNNIDCMWFKKNIWTMLIAAKNCKFSNRFIFSEESLLIKIFTFEIEEAWHIAPHEHCGNSSVADILMKLEAQGRDVTI